MRLEPLDVFVDSAGNRCQRLKGYRDLIVPRWPMMFQQKEINPTIGAAAGARARVPTAEGLLGAHGFSFADAEVLDVGCHDGACAFAMAEKGARHVDAIDVPFYGVRQTPGEEENPQTLAEQSGWLRNLREATSRSFGRRGLSSPSGRVGFFDLDVLDLDKRGAYDIVISWDTLEHIIDPERAMLNMYAALRPGGISFHEYNPFFAIDGGHSLCTLDFPYGHATLGDADFDRYIRTYRPEELDVALSFFRKSLNRMTIADLERYAESAGFERLAMRTWEKDADFWRADAAILSQCRALHVTVDLRDLVSRTIWVLFRRPCS